MKYGRKEPFHSLLLTLVKFSFLRIHELKTFEEVVFLEAHEAEVLSIAFSNPGDEPSNPSFMASASRDRLIHVFDVKKGFQLYQTLDDHTSSITAIKFSNKGKKLLSCAADKSVVFRAIQEVRCDVYWISPI